VIAQGTDAVATNLVCVPKEDRNLDFRKLNDSDFSALFPNLVRLGPETRTLRR